jgi:hypothetical protein
MSEDDTDAEVAALARVLDADPEELGFLAGLPRADLRRLRTQAGDALFAQDEHQFHRLAALTASVPAALAATIAHHAIPPLLAGMTAQVLDPTKASAMVARLPVPYLCDVAIAMNPDRAAPIVARIAPEQVAAVAVELARRREWVVIGGFVAHVSSAALAASVAVFSGRDLLHLSHHLDDRRRVDEITEQLSDSQLDDMISAAAYEDRWPLLATVYANAGAAHVARLRARFAAAPAAIREAAPADIRALA